MLLLPYIYIAVEALDDDGEFLDNKVEYVEDLQEIMEGGEYNYTYLPIENKVYVKIVFDLTTRYFDKRTPAPQTNYS